MNCTNIPTMTVCHLTAFRFLDVAYITKMLLVVSVSDTSQWLCVNFNSHDSKPEQAYSAVGSCVVQALWARKCADYENTNNDDGAKWCSHPLRNEAHKSDGCRIPDQMHWLGDDGNGHIEEQQAQGDCEPKPDCDQCQLWQGCKLSRLTGMVSARPCESSADHIAHVVRVPRSTNFRYVSRFHTNKTQSSVSRFVWRNNGHDDGCEVKSVDAPSEN